MAPKGLVWNKPQGVVVSIVRAMSFPATPVVDQIEIMTTELDNSR